MEAWGGGVFYNARIIRDHLLWEILTWRKVNKIFLCFQMCRLLFLKIKKFARQNYEMQYFALNHGTFLRQPTFMALLSIMGSHAS